METVISVKAIRFSRSPVKRACLDRGRARASSRREDRRARRSGELAATDVSTPGAGRTPLKRRSPTDEAAKWQGAWRSSTYAANPERRYKASVTGAQVFGLNAAWRRRNTVLSCQFSRKCLRKDVRPSCRAARTTMGGYLAEDGVVEGEETGDRGCLGKAEFVCAPAAMAPMIVRK